MRSIRDYEPLWDGWVTGRLIGEGRMGKLYHAEREQEGATICALVRMLSVPNDDNEKKDVVERVLFGDSEAAKEYYKPIVEGFARSTAIMEEIKGGANLVFYEDSLIAEQEDGVGADIIVRMKQLESIERLLSGGSVSSEEVTLLGIDICSALEVCALKGIAHGEVKPSNIFIGEDGMYKLGDFGLAPKAEPRTGISARYLAPETCRGDAPDPISDICSLGLVMYELLNAGRPPFIPASGEGGCSEADIEAAIDKRVSGAPCPPPVSARGALAQAILKAISPDRHSRFITLTEFKLALLEIKSAIDDGSLINMLNVNPNGSSTIDVRYIPSSPSNTAPVNQTFPLVKNADAPLPPVIAMPSQPTVAVPQAAGRKKGSSKTVLTLLIAAALLAGGGLLTYFLINSNSYNDALALMEQGRFASAADIFYGLDSFSDSEEMATECDYQAGLQLMKDGESATGSYGRAAELFSNIRNYKDSYELLKEASYHNALELLEGGRFPEAKSIFSGLTDYLDSADMVIESDYQWAVALYREDDYEGADKHLSQIPKDYKNAREYMSLCDYKEFKATVGDPFEISKLLKIYKGFSGAADTNEDCAKACDDGLFSIMKLSGRRCTRYGRVFTTGYYNGKPYLTVKNVFDLWIEFDGRSNHWKFDCTRGERGMFYFSTDGVVFNEWFEVLRFDVIAGSEYTARPDKVKLNFKVKCDTESGNCVFNLE